MPVPARRFRYGFPRSFLTDPDFKDGYEWGYLVIDPEEEQWTVPKLLNQVYRALTYERSCEEPLEEPEGYPWVLGSLFGELAYLLEVDRTLALTGLAHCQYLLSLLPVEQTPPWSYRRLSQARCLHDDALKAYRAAIRSYRMLGKSFAEAQRLALTGCEQREGSH